MGYFTTLPDTLLIGGTDLQSLPGIVVGDLSGLLSPGRRRGGNLTIPGSSGDRGTTGRPYAAYSFDVPITVLPDNPNWTLAASEQGRRAQMLANLQSVANLLSAGLVALTRRFTATSSTSVDHTCDGEFVDGLQMQFYNTESGNTSLQFVNLSGCWYSGATVIVP